MPEVGLVSQGTLTKTYWRGAAEDLRGLDYVKEGPRGTQRQYFITRPLPEKDWLQEELCEAWTRTVAAWLAEVNEKCEALLVVLFEWSRDLSLAGQEKKPIGRAVDECQEKLSALHRDFDPEPPFDLAGENVAVDPDKLFFTRGYAFEPKRTGRQWQVRELAAVVEACVEGARELPGLGIGTPEYLDSLSSFAEGLDDLDFPTKE